MKLIYSLALVSCYLLTSTSFATTNSDNDYGMEVLEDHGNYQRIKVDFSQYSNEDIDEDFFNEYSMDSDSDSPSPDLGEALVLRNLRAVYDADLPDWYKDEILEENGFTDWSQITDEEMDAQFSAVVIIDKLNEVDELLSTQTQSGSYQTFGLCSKKRKHKTKSVDFDLSTIDEEIEILDAFDNNENHSLTLDGTIKSTVTGEGNIEIKYFIKKRCGIPYGVGFTSTKLVFQSETDGEILLGARAEYEFNKSFSKEIQLLLTGQTFFIWYIPLTLEFGVKLEPGADFAFSSSAEGSVSKKLETAMQFEILCTEKDCQTQGFNDVTSNFSSVDRDDMNFELEAKASINPFVRVKAETALAFGIVGANVDLTDVEVVVEASAPAEFQAYYGNQCSDVDNDGVNEMVSGVFLDVYGQIRAYADFQDPIKKIKKERKRIGIGIPLKKGWQELEDYFGASLYRKHFYFNDLTPGGSRIMDPVMVIPDVLASNGKIQIRSRDCYPYANPVFEVDWGDGSPAYVGYGGTLEHEWDYLGAIEIKAKMLRDSEDRSFRGLPVSRFTNVSRDGESIHLRWLPVIAASNLIL